MREQLQRELAPGPTQDSPGRVPTRDLGAQGPAAFEDLSPAEKRVAIARDVVQQVELGQTIVQHGEYIRWYADGGGLDEVTPDLVEICEASGCHACAIGSVFMALARRGAISPHRARSGKLFGDDERADLYQYFDRKQLAMMETAFEGMPHGISRQVLDYATDVRRCQAFGENLRGEHLLLKIMQNVIDNGGEFVP